MKKRGVIGAIFAVLILLSVMFIPTGAVADPDDNTVEAGKIYMYLKSEYIVVAKYGVRITPTPGIGKTNDDGEAFITAKVTSDDQVVGASAVFKAKLTVYKLEVDGAELPEMVEVGSESYNWPSEYWDDKKDEDVLSVTVKPRTQERLVKYRVVLYGEVDPQWYSTIPHDAAKQTRLSTVEITNTRYEPPEPPKPVVQQHVSLERISSAFEGDTITISGAVTGVGTGQQSLPPLSDVPVRVKIYILEDGSLKTLHTRNLITDENGLFTFDWTIPEVTDNAAIQASVHAKDEAKQDDDIEYRADPNGALRNVIIFNSGWNPGSVIRDPTVILLLVEEGKENAEVLVQELFGDGVTIQWPDIIPGSDEVEIIDPWFDPIEGHSADTIVWTNEKIGQLYHMNPESMGEGLFIASSHFEMGSEQFVSVSYTNVRLDQPKVIEM
jgi:hypothetical protein